MMFMTSCARKQDFNEDGKTSLEQDATQEVESRLSEEVSTTDENMQSKEETDIVEEKTIEDTSIQESTSLQEELHLPEKGTDGCIIASGEKVVAPEGAETVVLSDEVNAEFLFSSGVALRNLQLISLSYDGEQYQQEEYVYNSYDFAEQDVLKVSCYLPDLYSNLLLQYEDPTGEFHRYFVVYDMGAEQPTIILQDAMDADIKLLQ